MIAHRREADLAVQTVAEHLQGTAKLCREHAAKIGLPLMGELTGLLHDLGKYSKSFQDYIQYSVDTAEAKKLKGNIDHSTAGAQYVWNTIASNSTAYAYIRQIIALCVASHHGGLIDCLALDGTDTFGTRMQKSVTETHYHECIAMSESYDKALFDRVKELCGNPALVAEFRHVCKLISCAQKDMWIGLLTRCLFSCLIDADRTDTIDFMSCNTTKDNDRYPHWESFITALEKRLAAFQRRGAVDDIRSNISKECAQAGSRSGGKVYTLTVPTGGGKTLASLRFAIEHAKHYNLDRIVYIIPYTSIIDQNVKEVRGIFQELSKEFGRELVLEYHSNMLSENPEEDNQEVSERQLLLAENWDAPIVFTTMVQFLNTLFAGGTRSVRRMHNLAKTVMVFDEVQTLPVKTVHLFNHGVNFLTSVCGSSALLCTATQPLLHNTEQPLQLAKKPEIIADVSALFQQLDRVEVLDKRTEAGWDSLEIADLIQSELIRSGSVLTVVNTKKHASELYNLCKDLPAQVYHLSTSMCPAHRLQVIKEIKTLTQSDQQEPVVCISTQLVEAGVDLDFGTVIRYVAGFDSILQAAGRCNRNGLAAEKGRVFVINPKQESLGDMPELQEGKACGNRVLTDFRDNPVAFGNSLLDPSVVKEYFRYFFYSRKGKMSYNIHGGRNSNTVDTNLIEVLSTNRLARNESDSKYPLVQSFKTAGEKFQVIDSPTTGIVVPYNADAVHIIGELYATDDITRERELLRKAQTYSVHCYKNNFNNLIRKGALQKPTKSGVYCLKESFYSDQQGVVFEEIVEKTAQCHIV